MSVKYKQVELLWKRNLRGGPTDSDRGGAEDMNRGGEEERKNPKKESLRKKEINIKSEKRHGSSKQGEH